VTALLWDVQRTHLQEAEFLFEAWDRSLDSPQYDLQEIYEGPEERLEAHIGGLVVGGPAVSNALLLPVLDRPDEDRYRTAAAALSILSGPQLDLRERVMARLDSAGEAGRWGITRAFQIANRKGIGRMLARDLQALQGPGLAARLQALAPRHYDPKRKLATWLDDGDPEVRRAAALLARRTGSSAALKRLIPCMDADDLELRAVAIESALIRGLPGSWQAACGLALGNPDNLPKDMLALHDRALTWVAMLGDSRAHGRILEALTRAPSPARLWAGALTGRVEAVDIACTLLDHPSLARLAAELVCTVAGLPIRERSFWLDEGAQGAYGLDPDEGLPPLDQDDLDADLIPSETLKLRLPDPEAVRRWWKQRAPSMRNQADQAEPGDEGEPQRYLGGEPLDADRLLWGLRTLSSRVRHPLAIELAMRSAGVHVIDTRRASAKAQLVQLAQVQRAIDSSDTPLDCQSGLPLLTSNRAPQPWH